MSVGCAYISLCWIHSISFPRKPGDSTTLMFTMCQRATIYAYHVTLQLNILDLDLTPSYECRVSDMGILRCLPILKGMDKVTKVLVLGLVDVLFL